AAATTGGTGASSEVESHGSCPEIASCSSAASSTVLVSGPGVSSEEAKATSPYLDEPPYVGFTPTSPQTAAGCRIEPPVSVPMPSGAWYAATAAAEPPDDPPGTLLRSHGLCEGPNAEFSVDEPIATSSILVLRSITTSAERSRLTMVASYGGCQPARILEPQVVGMSAVVNTSLSASGTPASGDTSCSPAATAAATTAATASASSAATCQKAGDCSSVASIWSRHGPVSSGD